MHRSELLAIVLVAVVLRLVFLALWAPGLIADASDYDRLARGLVDGHGYVNTRGEPTSWRPPLYPAFVAGVYRLSGYSSTAVRVVQIGLDLATIVLAYRIGRSLFGNGPGLAAALLVAVNLATISATGWVASETLFTFLLVWAVAVSLAWLRAIRAARPREAVGLGIGAGVLLAAGALTRGVLLLYPLPLLGLVAVAVRAGAPGLPPTAAGPSRARAGVAGGAALLLAFALTIAPWTWRNYQVHGAFVPIATQLGLALYGSYNPVQGWFFGNHPDDAITAAAERLPEQEANVFLTRAALDSAAASPRRTLRIEGLKILYFWVPIDWEVLPFYGIFNATYAFIAVWGAVYLAIGGRRCDVGVIAAVWLPVLYLFGMALVFYGCPRFRLPVEPLLAVVAGAGLAAARQRLGGPVSARLVGGTMVALLVVGAIAGPVKQLAKAVIQGQG
jgi:4-amino-4-deoxy-L-arabinose transferase-like glycosyltransferase